MSRTYATFLSLTAAAAVAAAVAVALSLAAAARAAFPGASGRLAFQSDRDGEVELYSMNLDGSAATRLTSSPDFEGNAAWSPDGTKIAFESSRDGGAEVYVMNATS